MSECLGADTTLIARDKIASDPARKKGVFNTFTSRQPRDTQCVFFCSEKKSVKNLVSNDKYHVRILYIVLNSTV